MMMTMIPKTKNRKPNNNQNNQNNQKNNKNQKKKKNQKKSGILKNIGKNNKQRMMLQKLRESLLLIWKMATGNPMSKSMVAIKANLVSVAYVL